MDPEGVNKFLRIVRFLIKKPEINFTETHIFYFLFWAPLKVPVGAFR